MTKLHGILLISFAHPPTHTPTHGHVYTEYSTPPAAGIVAYRPAQGTPIGQFVCMCVCCVQQNYG